MSTQLLSRLDSAPLAPASSESSPSIQSGSTLPWFSSPEEYESFRAAWRAYARARTPLSPSHHAAYALLRGRDPFRGFTENRRGNGQAPYGALRRALGGLSVHAVRWLIRDLEASCARQGANMDPDGTHRQNLILALQKLATDADLQRSLHYLVETAELRGLF